MPYSWDDDHDFTTTGGKGYSYHDARRSYDDVAVARTGTRAVYTYQSPFLRTDAAYPLVIGIDTTGSMAEWPRIFFDKLPLLYKEAVKYLPACAISFQAINDFEADGEEVALQPTPFGQGPQLDEFIGQLYPVGGGGGQVTESYEIFAAYNSFLEAPQALIKPIAIILGDEAPFDEVPAEVCRRYGLGTGSCRSQEAFARLHEKCDVYLVRKPYEGQDQNIIKKWKSIGLMPGERILMIADPRRVVDVILGILGILTGKVEAFEQELISRQDQSQVKDVMKSLHKLKANPPVGFDLSQRSVSRAAVDPGAKKSRKLALD